MASQLAPLVPAILRHLQGYAEVAGEDARDAAQFLARRLLLAAVAGACAFVALLMLCAWLLVLAWDTPWRAWTAAGLALAFVAAAAGLALPMLRRRAGPRTPLFPRIRVELERDRNLIERAVDRRSRATNGGDDATG